MRRFSSQMSISFTEGIDWSLEVTMQIGQAVIQV